jgi:hypothetical protein
MSIHWVKNRIKYIKKLLRDKGGIPKSLIRVGNNYLKKIKMESKKIKLSEAAIKQLSDVELGKVTAGTTEKDTVSTGTSTSYSFSVNTETETTTETEYDGAD